MEEYYDRIRDVLLDITPSHSPLYTNGWQAFECPHCKEIGTGDDGRDKLEINVEEGYCHCWRCGYASNITQFIRHYGTKDNFNDFIGIINDIKATSQYALREMGITEETTPEIVVNLPQDFKPVTREDKQAFKAYKYLTNRGLTDEMIRKYNIGYVGNYVKNPKDFDLKNRIIIPSYDSYGNLTYWLGRSYNEGTEDRFRYHNAKVEKTSIVFNEGLINVYEPIILCEGTFDSFALPNAIPLLGKSLDEDHAVYKFITEEAKNDILICLDDDARSYAVKMFKKLNKGVLKGRVKMVEMPSGYDPSDYYRTFGKKGVIELLRKAKPISEANLIFE